MRHSERCKVRSSFRDYTAHVAGLSSAAGQCNSSRLRDARLAAHVVVQILLHMLGAEQMCRGVEGVKICISESQQWNILELQYSLAALHTY